MGHIARLTTSAAMLAALAACDSGSGSGASTTRNFAADAGTAVKALDDGKTLTAQEGGVASVDVNFGGGPTALVAHDVAIKKNASGELSLIIDGVEQAFTTADRFIEPDGSSFGYDINDPAGNRFIGLFSQNGELDTVLDPNNPSYLQVWSFSTNQVGPDPNANEPRGFAVVGTETQAAALASLPSATYSGYAQIDTYPTTGFVNSATSRSRVNGDLSMAADFGAATIFGSIGNLDGNGPGQPNAPIAGSIAMDQTAISGNGFAGTLTPDATFLADTGVSGTTGSYAGTFYGPSADQLGGTMTLTGSENGQAFNGIGFFRGDQN